MTAHTAFLAIHVAAGSLGLVLGPAAMLAPKRRGRHTRAACRRRCGRGRLAFEMKRFAQQS
jgi:hypothetical protein